MVTKIQRVGIDAAIPLELAKAEAEARSMDALFREAQEFVRAQCLENIASLPDDMGRLLRHIHGG